MNIKAAFVLPERAALDQQALGNHSESLPFPHSPHGWQRGRERPAHPALSPGRPGRAGADLPAQDGGLRRRARPASAAAPRRPLPAAAPPQRRAPLRRPQSGTAHAQKTLPALPCACTGACARGRSCAAPGAGPSGSGDAGPVLSDGRRDRDRRWERHRRPGGAGGGGRGRVSAAAPARRHGDHRHHPAGPGECCGRGAAAGPAQWCFPLPLAALRGRGPKLGDPGGPARPLPAPLWEGGSVSHPAPAPSAPEGEEEKPSHLVRLLGCGGGKSALSPGSPPPKWLWERGGESPF